MNYDAAKARKYISGHAAKIVCPKCRGKHRPDRMADCVVQHACFCTKCNKVWIYRVDISQEVSKRRP